jgi:NADH:ubiquinone oxidoreductase subunit F (NADH-binding)
LGSVPIELVLGPEDYLFGEEKALLEVIEGRDAMPREADFPPYVKGLFVKDPAELNPAVVNNVETISNVPHIALRGASWFRSIGTADGAARKPLLSAGRAFAAHSEHRPEFCSRVHTALRPGLSELPRGCASSDARL